MTQNAPGRPDVEHFLVRVHRELRLREDLLPEVQERFLRRFRQLDLPPEGEIHGGGHHDLAPRVLEYRPPGIPLLEDGVLQPVRLRGQPRREPGRARADDHDVVGPFRRARPGRDVLDDLPPLRYRILDEPHPPSSPTMKRFGTLVSKFSLSIGRSALRPGAAIIIVIAPTGQASAQTPWPTHFEPWTRTAFPSMTPRTSPSGQTSRIPRTRCTPSH